MKQLISIIFFFLLWCVTPAISLDLSEIDDDAPLSITEPSLETHGHNKTAVAPIRQKKDKRVQKLEKACGSKQYCKEMSSCQEAKHYFKDCGMSNFDKDNDGVPCENVCRKK